MKKGSRLFVLCAALLVAFVAITFGAAQTRAVDETPKAVKLEIQDVKAVEYADCWEDSYYDYETEMWKNYNRYSYNPRFTVTLDNGQVLTSNDWGSVEYDGQWWGMSYYDDQLGNTWGVGKHTARGEIFGATAEFTVEVIENPVASIQVNDVKLIEHTNGFYNTAYLDNGEVEYYQYTYCPREATITLKNGEVFTGSSYEYNGRSYSLECITIQDHIHQWTVGNTYSAKAYLMGMTSEFSVSIVESPVESIYVPVQQIVENTGGWTQYGWDENKNQISYYYYNIYPNNFVVTLKNGKTIDTSYYQYEGIDYWMQYSNDQSSENPWGLGTHTAQVSFLGMDADYTVEIVENPYLSLEILWVENLIVGKGGWYSGSDYIYNLPDVGYKVTLRDGTEIIGSTEKPDNEVVRTHMQYDAPYTVGGENPFTLRYKGLEAVGSVPLYPAGDYEYTQQEGKLFITKYNGTAPENWVIPEMIDGVPVSGISQLGYWYTVSDVKSLSIPDCVNSLADSLLWSFESLETLSIGSGVNYLEYNMFGGCYNLQEITIAEENAYYCVIDGVVYDRSVQTVIWCPPTLTEIVVPATVTNIDVLNNYPNLKITFEEGSNSFVTVDGVVYTADMTKVIACDKDKEGEYIMPDTVTEIGTMVFAGCDKLTKVEVAQGVTEIAYCQFMNCSSLQEIVIPSSVTQMGLTAFYGCDALEKVHISDVAAWCGIDFWDERSNPLHYAGNLYVDGQLITDLEIPEGVEQVMPYAFDGGKCFESVRFPISLSYVGYNAFCGNVNLNKVVTHYIGLWCITSFDNAMANPLYYAHNLYQEDELITWLWIPEDCDYIPRYAFINGTCFESVELHENIESIDERAFEGCTGLTELKLPENVALLSEAFYGCTGLTELNIPGTTGMWSDRIFARCSGLKSVTLGEGLEYIGGRTFEGCTNLETVDFPSNPISVGEWCFSDCPLKDLELSEKTEYIDRYAFAGSGLSNVKVPAAVTDISYGAFFRCTDLTYVDLPDTLEHIGAQAFYHTGLFDMQQNGPIYADKAVVGYKGSSEGKQFFIKNGTLLIGANVFERSQITSIVIPASVKYINEYAFWECLDLTDVYYEGTEEQWNAIEIDYENECLTNATIHFNAEVAVPGDLDGDGTVTDNDALLLLRHSLFPNKYPVQGNADVNGDGYTSDADALYLLRHSLFPNKYPLH